MGPFGCTDGETEFLSPDGWIRIDQWNCQLIAQYDTNHRSIRFEKPLQYINQPYDGDMYHFQSRGLDMVLTPNHRVLFSKKYNPEKLQVISAQEVFDSHHRLTSGWDGMIPAAFFVGEGQLGIDLTDDELRLMVAVCADGHFPNNRWHKDFCCICVRRPRKRKRIVELLERLNIGYRVRNYPSHPTEFSYDFIAPENNKTLTKYWRATTHQLEIILDEMVHWDGCKENRKGVRIFSTTHKHDADFMQYVFACHNIRASISLIHQDVGQKNGYNVIENQSSCSVGMRHDTQKPKAEKVCKNRQYCFETTTGFWVARRNDKIFITGNSGKSSGCVHELIRRGHEQKPDIRDGIRRTRWAVIRNTYVQLRDSTIKTFHYWYPPKMCGEWRSSTHDYILTCFPKVQIEICFRALDREDQVSNLLSVEYTGAWVNEAREVPYGIIFEGLDGRIDRYPPSPEGIGGATWAGIIMDTNPPTKNSWWYKLFEQKRPEGYRLWKQPSGLSFQAENLANLKNGYYTNLAKGKSEMFINVYVHGQYGYTIEGRPVFPSYKDNVHVASSKLSPMKGVDLICGFDFALSPSIIIGQLTPRGQLLILDELGASGMGLKQFCKNQLLPLLQSDRYRGFKIMGYGDPSGASRSPTDESTCYDVLHSPEIGLNYIISAPTNALIPRIGAVENFLNRMVDGQPGIIVSPHCSEIREALGGGYCYKKIKGTEHYSDQPDKSNPASHKADALQYLCLYVDTKNEDDDRYKKFREQIGKQITHSGGDGITGM